MKNGLKIIIGLLAILLLAIPAMADTPTAMYTTNVRCGEADGPNPGLGYDYGFKINGQPIGSSLAFTQTEPGPQHGIATELTTDATPSDINSIFTIANSDGVTFDWTSTNSVAVVIVKSQDSYTYVYEPEAWSGTRLTTPNGKGISHIEFCWNDGVPSPEFPTVALPVGMLIGLVGLVYVTKKRED